MLQHIDVAQADATNPDDYKKILGKFVGSVDHFGCMVDISLLSRLVHSSCRWIKNLLYPTPGTRDTTGYKLLRIRGMSHQVYIMIDFLALAFSNDSP